MQLEKLTTIENSNEYYEKPLFPISVVADILSVHQRTLRIYDDEKLLNPNRSPKNIRLYSYRDIELGKTILFLTRNLGINLAGIKIIFNLLNQQGITLNSYTEHINEIAKFINISNEVQQENKEKYSKRGRKSSKIVE